jgi:6-phosphogluconate dehydrogenase
MKQAHIGLIGLGVMGSNFAQNFAHNGVTVSVYNRTKEKTDELVSKNITGIEGYYSLEEFIASLPTPRLIHLMVSSKGVDAVIDSITPLLENGDILVDLGNSNWLETTIRQEELKQKGIHVVGCGVSGGAEGALTGPSIMPGGDATSVDTLVEIYEKVAAKDFDGKPCVVNVGKGPAGHFVKMVHNGIEYAIMQSLAEIYGFLNDSNYTKTEIKEFIDELNTGNLESYLLEITSNILESKQDGSYLLDIIDHKAQGKGTGKWTVEAALDLGVATPSIVAAVFQRYLSAQGELLKTADDSDVTVDDGDPHIPNFDLTMAMTAVWNLIYLQGLELIAQADKEYNWEIDLKEVVRIWEGGCIIRSRLLENMIDRISSESFFDGLNEALAFSHLSTTPLPVINTTIDYGLTLTSNLDEMALIQAQRDYFGQHTYRIKGKSGSHTGGWV